tara:strand:+ start:3269 stop:4534 length:1266 start_codon:yes stop_codon:yes gene_type:complete
MGNPLKKAFKSINKAANKIADKLIPKELAPFLPILGAFAPGLGLTGSAVFNQYILPQILTAASSAKMSGEIDPTQQAITGIMSALQGPVKQTKAEAALLKENPELARQVEKANKLADATTITDKARLKELAQAGDIEGLGIFGDYGTVFDAPTKIPFTEKTFGDFLGGPFQPGDYFGPQEILSFTDDAGNIRYFNPESSALDDFLATEITTPIDLSGLSGQEFKDAIVEGGNISKKGFDTKLGALQKELGSQQGLQALNKARAFFDSPVGFNYPTLAKVGIGASPFLAAQAGQLKDEQEALLAQQEADRAAFNDSRQALTEYFRRLSDPTGMFAAMGGRVGAQEGGIMSAAPGMPQDMQVDGRNGTFIPMGVKEKADDVPAMLSKNEFVMTADAVRGMGNGDVNAGAQKMYDLMNSLEARV